MYQESSETHTEIIQPKLTEHQNEKQNKDLNESNSVVGD